MPWVDTGAIAAKVVQMHPLRDGTSVLLIHPSSRDPITAIAFDSRISASTDLELPIPATGVHINDVIRCCPLSMLVTLYEAT